VQIKSGHVKVFFCIPSWVVVGFIKTAFQNKQMDNRIMCWHSISLSF